MDLIKMDLIKMVMACMDLIKMDLIKMDLIYMVMNQNQIKLKFIKGNFFEDQKGKGYVDLPTLLSKMYTNNNSKELKTNIKNLLNHLYHNKQITKQVYNILNKAITYKNDS